MEHGKAEVRLGKRGFEVLALLGEILGQPSNLLRRLALVEGNLSLRVGKTGLAVGVKKSENRDGDK